MFGNLENLAIPIVAIVCSVGLPMVIIILAVQRTIEFRQHRLDAAMEERKLLIEKGVTNLPPLSLIDPAVSRRRYRTLAWGLILLALAGGAYLSHTEQGPLAPLHGVEPLLACLGAALVGIHFIVRAYEQRDNPPAEQDAVSQTKLDDTTA